MGFRQDVPKLVYENTLEVKKVFSALSALCFSDPLKARLVKEIRQALSAHLQATEMFIKSIVISQDAPGGWGAQSKDLQARWIAIFDDFPQATLTADIKQLTQLSAVFKNSLPMEVQYSLEMVERPSGFRVGITNFARNPFYLLVVFKDSLASKIGLKLEDRIISLGDREFKPTETIEEFKVLLKSYLGRKAKAVVERDGKREAITLKIPKTLLPYLYE